MGAFIGLLSFLLFIVVVLVILGLPGGLIYVVQQQTFVIIERLGKFNRITGPGLHVKIPYFERVAKRVDMRTNQVSFRIDAKTKDNVTIELDVSIQFRVDGSPAADITQSGVYRCIYTLTDPVGQMKDYFADALRSEIPARSLEDVFIELTGRKEGL